MIKPRTHTPGNSTELHACESSKEGMFGMLPGGRLSSLDCPPRNHARFTIRWSSDGGEVRNSAVIRELGHTGQTYIERHVGRTGRTTKGGRGSFLEGFLHVASPGKTASNPFPLVCGGPSAAVKRKLGGPVA